MAGRAFGACIDSADASEEAAGSLEFRGVLELGSALAAAETRALAAFVDAELALRKRQATATDNSPEELAAGKRLRFTLVLVTLVVLVRALEAARMRSTEHAPRATSALTRTSPGTGAPYLRLLAFGVLVPAAWASCSSAPTCPAHAGDRLLQCSMPGSPVVRNWLGHRMYSFMGNGLYTLGKISKDETNCCYDVEVQAFLIPILSRDGTTRVRACMRSNMRSNSFAHAFCAARNPSRGPTSGGASLHVT